MARRLKRDTRNAILGGVAAGFGEYIDLDPVIVRLLFLVLCLAGGSGLIIYVVCWLIIPRDDGAREEVPGGPPADQFAEEVREAGERVVENIRQSGSEVGRGRLYGGLALMAVGLFFLLDQFMAFQWLRLRYLWPLALVAVGVALFVQGMRSRDK